METARNTQTRLGIDLGPNSIGWALLKTDGDNAVGIIAAGARAFEAGLNDLEMDGKGKSRNVQRREARQRRRQTERHRRRLVKLARLLQRAGLLPGVELEDGEQRHAFFQRLDETLNSPYQLRARALDEKLTPYELGRALYHLAQRRGFLSNRKAPPEKDEEEGQVKSGISELQRRMDEAGARTLGEYFSRLDPHEERIRSRYTSRKMYEDEFERIWEAQKSYYPEILTDELKKNVYRAIFYQRPLKNQKHLIGECGYEKGCRRAPWAVLSAQRFRYLQRLNDLLIESDGIARKLSAEERETLKEAFETEGDLEFSRMRKLLDLPARGSRFNLERGGEKKLPGNRTAAKLRKVFGDRWDSFTGAERDAIVEDVRSIVKDETLKKRGIKVWGLDEEAAEAFSNIKLEDGHCNFSRQALKKLLPLLEEGKPLQTALREIYPDRWEGRGRPMELLPTVRSDEFQELRNPIVERSLTELRRVVNAIIKKYGKPARIRIELARELKQTANQREDTWKKNRRNEKAREAAAKKIMEEAGIDDPRPGDILKVRLAEECNWECPYTGKGISMDTLVGDNPQFDVEHIIPFPRSLDNSFLNKTLCHVRENREVKRGYTPYEAYSSDPEKWSEILARVRRFKGDARDAKLRRFRYTEEDVDRILGDFTNRQLNDTRYASRRAREYLGLLYGAGADGVGPDGKQRVQVSAGQVTAFFRNEWELNRILGDGPGKARDDHRQHAIDALVVALTGDAEVKMLSDAAERAAHERRRLFGSVEPPWEGFLEDVRRAIDGIVVSHRVDKRVRGPLHQETFYSPRGVDENGTAYVHIRKHLSDLTAKEVEGIVDPAVRESVKSKLNELGQTNPKKAFASRENHPTLMGKGGEIPIHRVRIRRNLDTFPVGEEEHRVRHVISDANHHMELVEDGRTGKWEGHVVSMFDAHQRKRAKEPVVKRDHGEGKRFLFSLSNREIIELDDNGERAFFVVRTVPQSKQIKFVPVNDAKKRKSDDWGGLTAYPETLRKRNCRKVTVSPLGEVRDASD